jgi:hypothetical protein
MEFTSARWVVKAFRILLRDQMNIPEFQGSHHSGERYCQVVMGFS